MDKDPYLDELDMLGDEEIPTVQAAAQEGIAEDFFQEDATRIDMPVEKNDLPETISQEEVLVSPDMTPVSSAEILSLSPDLPVQLVVVMDRKNTTIADLLELKNGQVMEWEKTQSDAVELVVSGKVIGRGESVDVDGKLGVRILKLLK